jgi:hypothetical protein
MLKLKIILLLFLTGKIIWKIAYENGYQDAYEQIKKTSG